MAESSVRQPPEIQSWQLGIKVYYEPTELPDVDLVVVHGLGANPDSTWEYRHSDERITNWLQDQHMLPSYVQKARIMRFGYDSRWYGNKAVLTRLSPVSEDLLLGLKRERKRRPLLFLGHCWGGLVVFKALLLAQSQEHRYEGIFKSCFDVVSMGTPYHGTSDGSSIRSVYAAIAAAFPEN
ncbi:MAG: hypothetical protein Q9187_003763 [Circinaria calcarea]